MTRPPKNVDPVLLQHLHALMRPTPKHVPWGVHARAGLMRVLAAHAKGQITQNQLLDAYRLWSLGQDPAAVLAPGPVEAAAVATAKGVRGWMRRARSVVAGWLK